MSRYRSTGQLDDPQVIDGDTHFIGLDQMNQPTLLGEGQYQVGENIRIENGKVVSRGGLNPLNLAANSSTKKLPSKPLDIIKYQNPRSSLLLKSTMSVPSSNGTAEVKIIARNGSNVIWNHETSTNISGSGIPSSTVSVRISGNVFRYVATTFPNQLFNTYPNLQVSVYLVKFTSDELTGDSATEYLTGPKEVRFWPNEPENFWDGTFHYTNLEGWGNHQHDIFVRNNVITNIDQNFGLESDNGPHWHLEALQEMYEEYKEFTHHNYIGNYGLTSTQQFEHRFIPSKYKVVYQKIERDSSFSFWGSNKLPPMHTWVVWNQQTNEYTHFSVTTDHDRFTTNSLFVSKLKEIYKFMWEDTPEYTTGYYVWENKNGTPEGGVSFPVEVIQSEDEDILVVMRNQLSGVFTSQTADINPQYTNEAEVSCIQSFDQAVLFSDGYRPKTWNGEQSSVVDLSTSQSSGTDFACPPAPFGIYVANRLAVPFYEDSKTSVAFSNTLEMNGFLNKSVFSANRGTSDVILAMSVFHENQLLIFNRNSIHLINNLHGSDLSKTSSIFEITRQYGIAGHRSLAQNGSYYYFISSEGNIQVLVPSSDPAKGAGIAISKITMDQMPLSKPIQKTIDQIDRESLPLSIAHYHRNKVYFAFGIDRPYPNTIAVYDSLRSSWISIDKFNFDINIKGMASIKNRLFILTDTNICEYEVGLTDKIAHYNLEYDYDITSKLKTRDYRLGTHAIKKFTRGSVSISTGTNANISTTVNTTDPNNSIQTQNYITEKTEDKISRYNISDRGYSANVEFNFSNNSQADLDKNIEISNVSVEGYNTSRTTGDFV